MARQALSIPDNDFRLPVTTNPTSESGGTWKGELTKVEANFTDLYNNGSFVGSDENITGTKTFNVDPRTLVGVGAAAGTGVAAVENGNGALHKTVLTLTNTPVVLADEAGVVAYGGLKIYDFPEGFIHFFGATANLTLGKSAAGVNADWDGDFALGTVTASNNATLASTEQDLIPTTATPQATASLTTATGVSTTTEASKILDGHTTAKDVFLNILVDDADHDVTTTPTNIVVNGTITLLWANLGDYT